MRRLAIIPARAGSKRFPDKNVAIFNDKPLIFNTIDNALGLFDKVIFTTDGINIIKIADNYYKDYNVENSCELEIDKRPSTLATDNSKVIDTVMYYLDEDYDQIWLLLPTCPLRTKDDIRKAKKLLTKDVDSVISITEFPFPPSLGLLLGNEGFITDYDYRHPWTNGNTRSQDHPTVHRPNGAIYGSWTKKLKENKNYYKGRVKGYYMPIERSIDIDNEIDIKVANALNKEL